MQETGVRNDAYGADKFGFKDLAAVRWNLTEPSLYEFAIAAGEASLVEGGALCAETGHHTGRSPKDKHTVVDDLTENTVWWDGNRKMSKENFDNLLADFIAHARGKKLFAQDLYGGADAKYVKVPFPVLFVIVPTLGALFLMFLPLIGFVMFAQAIAKKLASLVTHGATDLAATVQPGNFAAGNAYFTGKPEEKKEGAAPASTEIEKLEKEIQERKEQK